MGTRLIIPTRKRMHIFVHAQNRELPKLLMLVVFCFILVACTTTGYNKNLQAQSSCKGDENLDIAPCAENKSTSEKFTIVCDEKSASPIIRNYYLADTDSKLLIGSYKQEPILYDFGSVCLLVCGNRSNELFIVNKEETKIKLQDVISIIRSEYPKLMSAVFSVDKVYQNKNGEITVELFSLSYLENDIITSAAYTEKTLVLIIDENSDVRIQELRILYECE